EPRHIERRPEGGQSVGGTHVIVVSPPSRGRLGQCSLYLGLAHVGSEHRYNRTRDLVLHREHILNIAIITLGPAMRAGAAIDELSCNAEAVAGALNAALQDVANAELLTDLTEVNRPALVVKRRVPSDHKQLG